MAILVGVRGKLDIIPVYFLIPVHYMFTPLSLTTDTIQEKRDWLITPDGLSSQPLDTLPQVLSPI